MTKGCRPRIVIDGAAFDTLEGFLLHFSQVAGLEGVVLTHSLDAFNDVLRGGFGTPAEGFVLVWSKHEVSRRRLGHAETLRQLRLRQHTPHLAHASTIAMQIHEAELGLGSTVFDWLVEIIRDHGMGGSEAEDGVELELI